MAAQQPLVGPAAEAIQAATNAVNAACNAVEQAAELNESLQPCVRQLQSSQVDMAALPDVSLPCSSVRSCCCKT